MKIVVITEEDEFYLPLAVEAFLQACAADVREIVAVRNPLLPNHFAAAHRFLKVFGVVPLLHHAGRLVKAKILDRFPSLNHTGRHFSVRRVALAHGIPYRYEVSVNSPVFLSHLTEVGPELIACISPTQLFRDKLIALPPLGCLNIHTAKLPHYRGLYPTYWAMASGERDLGISIHYLDQGIDTGRVLLQEELPIPPRATLDQMLTETKVRGGALLARAIQLVADGKAEPIELAGDGSYYSFPTRYSYRQFCGRGFRLW